MRVISAVVDRAWPSLPGFRNRPFFLGWFRLTRFVAPCPAHMVSSTSLYGCSGHVIEISNVLQIRGKYWLAKDALDPAFLETCLLYKTRVKSQ